MNFLKSFKKKHLIYATALVAIFAFILLFPTEASAETIQQTLRDNDQIKELHRGLLNIVNIPVILLIIVIAFSEMLRLKIDTYGFKKILPTLILAIVAAQFSYLFCKLIIDAANMTITLFTDPNLLSKTFGEASTLPSKYSKTFEALFPTPPDWVNFTYGMFFEILLKVLFLFVGSILLLVLCFLFLIRGWMIYFLVIVSPVAFMALSLPQTKSYFNKWWSEFIKWTFMPVPSIFFLWLGVTVLGHPIITSSWLPIPIMSVIIAAICLYAAIKVPFKLGGVAMDKFWNYSGAKWGLGKAKDKWFDPWLDDAKRRVGNWYQSQGNKHNLLGWNVRRGQEVTARRAWRKKEEEGYKNQNFREAFGGKFGKDGDEFMSVEKQAKYGEWLDNIDSLFGETEWKDLDLREKYFRTEKGQQAALRSAQYGLRMEGTQQLIDNVKRTARIKAFARDDEYIKDDHYKRMLDVRNKAKAENFALEMEERKIEGDMYQTVEGEAYLLDMAVEAYDVWTDKLKKKQEELAKATTEAQKRVIQAEIKAIEEEQRKAEVSYQETAKKLLSNDKYFKKDTREFDGLSYMFRDILTDENGKLQGVELDSQGNFISADVTKARRLAEVMGFKPGTTSYGYYNGRRTKRYGIIVKEEVASVQGKRTGEDSIFEIVNTPFEWEAIAKIITGLTGGLTEKQIRKTSAEVANIFKGLSINNAQWTPRHLWLTNEVEAKFGKELTAIGNKVRENMALKTTAAIERFANVSAEMTKVKKNVLAKFDQQIKQAADEENARRTAQGLEALKGKPLDHWTEEYVINNLATTQAYQRELIKETKEHISVNYGIKNSEVEHIYNDDNVVQFEYNQKTGRVEARVNAEAANATDAEERTKFLAVINSAIINGNSRGSEGEAKNSFSGKNDDLIPSIKREMGKNQEEFYQHERVSKVLQEAIKAEVSKMLAEGVPESELRRLGYIK